MALFSMMLKPSDATTSLIPTSFPTSPPITTCLLVRAYDTFGDGWGQNVTLSVKIIQILSDKSLSIETVSLDCFDSFDSCLAPPPRNESESIQYLLELSTGGNDTDNGLVSFGWEIFWSVQYVQQGIPTDIIYGHEGSIAVIEFNYNQSQFSLVYGYELSVTDKILPITYPSSLPCKELSLLLTGSSFGIRSNQTNWYLTEKRDRSKVLAYGLNFTEINTTICLPDGSYIFRMTGALDLFSQEIQWTLCNLTGAAQSEYQIDLVEGVCMPVVLSNVDEICSFTPTAAPSQEPMSMMIRPQDFRRSPIAVYFVAALLCFLLTGCLFFRAWDSQDRYFEKYITQARSRISKTEKSRYRQVSVDRNQSQGQLSNSLAKSIRKINNLKKSEDESPETLVSAFVNRVLNSTGLTDKRGIIRFKNALWREHPWISPFAYSSMRFPRAIRYLRLVVETLILISLDSLAFKILFPDDNTCQKLNNDEEKCIHKTSFVYSDRSQCVYLQDGTCDFNTPPSTILVDVLLAILISLLSFGPKVINNFLLIELCSKKPNFQDSQLPNWFVHLFVSQGSSLGDLQSESYLSSELGQTISFGLNVANEANDHLSILKYCDTLSVDEEMDFLVRSVRDLLNVASLVSSYPWRPLSVDHESQETILHCQAVMKLIGLNPDGTPSQLSVLQYIRFGSHYRYLRRKITQARMGSKSILSELKDFGEDEQDNQDSLLIQHFLLEQLPPLQRLSLSQELFQFDHSDPLSVEWYKWLGAWIFEILLITVMIYWILVWIITIGEVGFERWLRQYVYCLVQDVFVSQVILVFILHVAVIEHLQPQIKHLSQTLNQIILQRMAIPSQSSSTSPSSLPHTHTQVSTVVQHISAACRASRHEQFQHLPSAMFLSTITDHDVNLLRSRRHNNLSLMATVLISFPVVFGFLGEDTQSMFFEIFVVGIWGGFLFVNEMLLKSFPRSNLLDSLPIYLMVALYLSLSLLAIYYFLWYHPRATRRRQEKLTRGTSWRTSSRPHRTASSISRGVWSSVIELIELFLFVFFSPSDTIRSSRTQATQQIITWKNMNLMMMLPHTSHVESLTETSDGLSEVDEKKHHFSLSRALPSNQEFETSHRVLSLDPAGLVHLSQTKSLPGSGGIPEEIQQMRASMKEKSPLKSILSRSVNTTPHHRFHIGRFSSLPEEVRWTASSAASAPAEPPQ
jgi:hypothetical protein